MFSAALLLALSLTVQSQDLRFNSLELGEGLPSNWIFAITQDPQGFIWVGTDAGLVRFDGYETQIFQRQEADSFTLASNQIRSIATGSPDAVWIGTEKGLNRLDPATLKFESVQLGEATNPTVYALVHGNDQLFVGTDNGLYQLHAKDDIAEHVNITRDLRIYSIAVDHYENLWLGTKRGLFKLDNRGELSEVTLESQQDSRVFDVAVDKLNNLWIAAGRHLYSKRAGDLKPVRELVGQLPDHYVTSVQPLATDSVAIGTLDGLFIYQPTTKAFATILDKASNPQGLSDHQVYELFEDRAGTMWVGTFNGGVGYVNPQNLNFGLHLDRPDCRVRNANFALNDANGLTWVAHSTGITRIDGATKCRQYTVTESNPSNYIGLFIDRQQRLWARLEPFGLAYFDTGAEQFRLLADPVVRNLLVASVVVSNDGRIWLGTEGAGLYQLNSETLTIALVEGFHSLHIYDLQLWADGLLMATSEGAFLYNLDRGTITSPFKLEGNPSLLTTLVDEQEQRVWLGSRSDGLFKVQLDNGVVERVAEEAGFSGKTVTLALRDRDGTTWIGSDQGLFRLPRQLGRFVQYQMRDGLQHHAFVAGFYNSKSHTLLLAGRNGLNRIDNGLVSYNQVPPQLQVTHFGSPQQREQLPLRTSSSPIFLEHQRRDFSLQFAALHFDDPSRNRYAYQLENYDSNWIETSADQRQVTYTNLPTGQYRLALRAANKDGVWSQPTTVLDVTIHPAIWATWWAKLLYLFLTALVLACILRWRTRAADLRAAAMAEQVKERTQEIASQKKTIEQLLGRKDELFVAISHEFRTPLTLLKGPLNILRGEIEDDRHRQELSLIDRSTRRLLSLVDQLLTLAKIDRDTDSLECHLQLSPLLIAVAESFRPAAQERGIILKLPKVSEELSVLTVDDTLEIVLSNLLSNAIKFSPLESQVEIEVIELTDSVEVLVRDQGPGIAPADQLRIFDRFYRASNGESVPGTGLGLAIAKELALRSGGDLTVHSDGISGSSLKLTLRKTTAAPIEARPVIELDPMASATLVHQPQENVDPSRESAIDVADQAMILIIEDDADMGRFIDRCLSSQFNCLLATTGESGIALAEAHIPDLIICDVMMPGKNGFEVARHLREQQPTSHVPIIMLTARVDHDSRLRAWEENVDEYIHKPFAPAELLARIDNILAIRRILQRRFSRDHLEGAETAQPDALASIPAREHRFLRRLDRAIEKNWHEPKFGTEQMASAATMSLRQLQRKLKALTDHSPADYLREYRLSKAAEQLKRGTPVGVVSDQCGFSSPNLFSRSFKARYGVPPKRFQKKSSGTK